MSCVASVSTADSAQQTDSSLSSAETLPIEGHTIINLQLEYLVLQGKVEPPRAKRGGWGPVDVLERLLS